MGPTGRPPQAAPFGRLPSFWLDPLSQSSDISDDDAAMISGDHATPFESTEHQSDGFPSRAYVARDFLMGELHTDQDPP
jgi:hypothetical protein